MPETPRVIPGLARGDIPLEWLETGTFSSPPTPIKQNLPYLNLVNVDSATRTFTLIPRQVDQAHGTITVQILVGGITAIPTAPWGSISVDSGATVGSVGWFYSDVPAAGPRGAAGSAPPIVFPTGASIIDDGAGGILFKGATSGQVNLNGVSSLLGGANVNWALLQNGIWSVLNQVTSGLGPGLAQVLGNSPTPAAVQAGATAMYSPVGNNLSHTDATHQTPPTTPVNAQAQGTTQILAEFNPTADAGVSYYRVYAYIKATTNGLGGGSSAAFMVTTDDDGDGAPFTFQCNLIRASTGAQGTTIPAGIVDTFYAVSPPIPLKADASGLGGSSTKQIHTKVVTAAGTGTITYEPAIIIERLAN